MIRVIMGKKGSGKTKQMIEMINNAVQTEHGNVVCIERGSKLTYDIHYQIRLVEASSYDIDSGSAAMYRFIREDHPMPSAIIAINDFTAVGIVRALREQGMRIPEDVSVVSFDNTYIAETCMPRLTCVGYDYKLFGKLLIETAIKAIHNEEPPRVQMVKSGLVIRDSCKQLK